MDFDSIWPLHDAYVAFKEKIQKTVSDKKIDQSKKKHLNREFNFLMVALTFALDENHNSNHQTIVTHDKYNLCEYGCIRDKIKTYAQNIFEITKDTKYQKDFLLLILDCFDIFLLIKTNKVVIFLKERCLQAIKYIDFSESNVLYKKIRKNLQEITEISDKQSENIKNSITVDLENCIYESLLEELEFKVVLQKIRYYLSKINYTVKSTNLKERTISCIQKTFLDGISRKYINNTNALFYQIFTDSISDTRVKQTGKYLNAIEFTRIKESLSININKYFIFLFNGDPNEINIYLKHQYLVMLSDCYLANELDTKLKIIFLIAIEAIEKDDLSIINPNDPESNIPNPMHSDFFYLLNIHKDQILKNILNNNRKFLYEKVHLIDVLCQICYSLEEKNKLRIKLDEMIEIVGSTMSLSGANSLTKYSDYRSDLLVQKNKYLFDVEFNTEQILFNFLHKKDFDSYDVLKITENIHKSPILIRNPHILGNIISRIKLNYDAGSSCNIKRLDYAYKTLMFLKSTEIYDNIDCFIVTAEKDQLVEMVVQLLYTFMHIRDSLSIFESLANQPDYDFIGKMITNSEKLKNLLIKQNDINNILKIGSKFFELNYPPGILMSFPREFVVDMFLETKNKSLMRLARKLEEKELNEIIRHGNNNKEWTCLKIRSVMGEVDD